MKRMIHSIPILCTLLLLGAGAFLPRMVSAALDFQLEKQTILREDPPVSLQILTDFYQTLGTFRYKQTQIELTEGFRMTADEVETAVLEILRELPVSGEVYPVPETVPVLVTNREDPGRSGIFWRCVWGESGWEESGGSEQILWLDDQTAQMVALEMWVPDALREPTIEYETRDDSTKIFVRPDYTILYPEAIVAVGNYCQSNYPVDTVTLSRGTPREVNAIDDMSSSFLTEYTMKLSRDHNGKDETFMLPLRLRGEWLYMNI